MDEQLTGHRMEHADGDERHGHRRNPARRRPRRLEPIKSILSRPNSAIMHYPLLFDRPEGEGWGEGEQNAYRGGCLESKMRLSRGILVSPFLSALSPTLLFVALATASLQGIQAADDQPFGID